MFSLDHTISSLKLGISLAHQVTPTFRGVRFLEVAKAVATRFNSDWRVYGMCRSIYSIRNILGFIVMLDLVS
jgi:hypothetical protein